MALFQSRLELLERIGSLDPALVQLLAPLDWVFRGRLRVERQHVDQPIARFGQRGEALGFWFAYRGGQHHDRQAPAPFGAADGVVVLRLDADLNWQRSEERR